MLKKLQHFVMHRKFQEGECPFCVVAQCASEKDLKSQSGGAVYDKYMKDHECRDLILNQVDTLDVGTVVLDPLPSNIQLVLYGEKPFLYKDRWMDVDEWNRMGDWVNPKLQKNSN